MTLVILLMVGFLFVKELLGLLGLRDPRVMNEAAKRIAAELHELHKRDEA